MHSKLVSVRPHDQQRVLNCGNCLMDVFFTVAKPAAAEDKNPFSDEKLDRDEELKRICSHKGGILLSKDCLVRRPNCISLL